MRFIDNHDEVFRASSNRVGHCLPECIGFLIARLSESLVLAQELGINEINMPRLENVSFGTTANELSQHLPAIQEVLKSAELQSRK
jgi:hypothetical protein